MKKGIAGTVESNDVRITVSKASHLDLQIKSIVYEFYGEQIKKTILDTLEELNITKLKILVEDKGALDYTIKSRLITAIKRLGEIDE